MSDGTAKTVVFGFDALSFRYLDKFDTPNFDALRERGIEAPLESIHPPWTGSAWPSMYTGIHPGEHGVYSFFDFGDGYPDDADVVSRNDVRAPALWNYLTDRDRRSLVLNVPVTHPAEAVDGVVVPGYLAPEDAPGHPEGIRADIEDAIGTPYRIYGRTELIDDPDAKLDGYIDLVDLRRRAIVYLLKEWEWEFAFVQVQKTDAVFHNFDDRAAFERVYAAADDLLGMVLDVVGPEVNVIVCSDHGMGHNTGYGIYVNDVLRDHGYVHTVEGNGSGVNAPSLGERKAGWIAEAEGADNIPTEDGDGSQSHLSGVLIGAASALQSVGVSPASVYAVAERVGLSDVLTNVVPTAVKRGVRRDVDWRRSDAYCRLSCEQGIRINLDGREPNGTVPESEYETVRDDIIALLSDLETPAGEPAFEWVKPREDVYDGPHVDAAPDVCLRATDMNHSVVADVVGRQFVPVNAYKHRVDGVFLGAGPGFGDAVLDCLSLVDVAPTVMALLGEPVPARMSGSVPDVVTVPWVRRKYDVPYGTGTADSSDGQIEERLEDLGYL
jgi:predicted AlkP superfamily phosphohydrolase/phosphomutase